MWGGQKLYRVQVLKDNWTATATVDIKTLLPKVYKKLTLDNFAFGTKLTGKNGADGSTFCDFNLTYDASTGILKKNRGYGSSKVDAYADIYCYYVD